MAGPLKIDKAGNLWDTSGPSLRFMGRAPGVGGPLASPQLPYEGPQAAANLTRTQQEVNQAQATAAANTSKANSEATSAAIKAKADQIDLNVKLGTPPGDPTKTGQDYIATLPPGVRDLTTQMLAGRYPAVINRNIPVVNQAVLAANHANPSFDATKYNMRVQLMNKTLTGGDADELKALNTAITHAGVLYDQTAALPGGADYGWAPLTHAANALENWSHSTSPGYKNFLDTMQKYSQEEAKTYGINTGGQQQQTQLNYDINDPGQTIQSNIKNDIALLGGRMAAILNKYNLGNAGQAPLEPLSPDARAVLQRLAPQVLQKEFSQRPDPMAQAMGITPFSAGGNQPPPPNGSGGNTPPNGFSAPPPPTGPTTGDNLTPGGYNTSPDPQSAQFWADAARQQVPYRTALSQWQSDVKMRGLQGITPPPPLAYDKAATYIRNNPNVPYQPFSSIIRTPNVQPVMNPVEAMQSLAMTGPGVAVGHAANAAAMDLPTMLAGDQGARYNVVSSALHPNYAATGDVIGTGAGLIGVSKALDAIEAAGSDLPLLRPYMRGIGISAAPGADQSSVTSAALRRGLTADNLYGATSGAAQNPDNPALGAAGGMALMTGGNLAGQAAGRYLLAPALNTGVGQSLVNGARGMFAASPISPVAALDSGESMLFNRANPSIDAIRGKLSDAANLNLPYALADADPRLQALAGSAVRKSPDVLALANQNLVPRQLGQGERALRMIDTHLAPTGDIGSIQADARTRAQNATSELYQQALKAPTPNDPQLNAMMGTPAGQQAARNAYSIALNSGESPADLSFATGINGEPIINANPNWRTLQYVKMGLDKVVTDNKNPITGNLDFSDPANRALNTLRANFVGRLGELNPAYANANAEYSRIIGQGDAANQGYNATARGVTPDQVQSALANNASNVPQYQQGYASSMADAVNNTPFSANPYNRIYGTPNQQVKVNMIFPNAGRFAQANGLENDMSRTVQEALGGSQTQPRAEADKLFTAGDAADTGLDLLTSAAAGAPGINLPGLLLRKGVDAWKLGMGRAKADAIGPILLNTDPTTGLSVLEALQRQAMMRQAYTNQMRAAGGMFAAPITYGYLGQQQ